MPTIERTYRGRNIPGGRQYKTTVQFTLTVDVAEHEAWSRRAKASGKTLSAFMREAAREKLAREQTTDATDLNRGTP